MIKNEPNRVIQLSSTVMEHVTETLVGIIAAEKMREVKTSTMSGFTYRASFGELYHVKCRAYRDDSNDPDVEEVLLEMAGLKPSK
jgi:hypothetical protein